MEPGVEKEEKERKKSTMASHDKLLFLSLSLFSRLTFRIQTISWVHFGMHDRQTHRLTVNETRMEEDEDGVWGSQGERQGFRLGSVRAMLDAAAGTSPLFSHTLRSCVTSLFRRRWREVPSLLSPPPPSNPEYLIRFLAKSIRLQKAKAESLKVCLHAR